jgi:hypothetical protein
MVRSIKVEIDGVGRVHSLEPAGSIPEGRAILTWQTPAEQSSLYLAESSLAEDWLRPEEDAAWAHLQPDRTGFLTVD